MIYENGFSTNSRGRKPVRVPFFSFSENPFLFSENRIFWDKLSNLHFQLHSLFVNFTRNFKSTFKCMKN